VHSRARKLALSQHSNAGVREVGAVEGEEYEQIQAAYLARLVSRLQRSIARIQRLPQPERRIAQLALEGREVHEIAQRVEMAEDAVWRILATVAGEKPEGVASGDVAPFEGAGLGADTDPGVTGGYGDTGFGSIGNEPDVPVPEEPNDQREQRSGAKSPPEAERSNDSD